MGGRRPGFNTNPVVEDVTGWATQAGCDPQPILATEGVNVELTRWSGCVPGVAVELHTIRGGGHFWPGGNLGVLEFDDSELAKFRALVGSTPGQPDTTRVLWEFFTEHPVPPIVTAQ